MTNAVYLVTTNKRKYEEYKEVIEAQGVTLKQYEAELINHRQPMRCILLSISLSKLR